MKIAHVVFNLAVGGMERLIVDLATRQSLQGDEVVVFCIADRGALADELDAVGVPVIALQKRAGPDLRTLWTLRGALRARRCDVVHTHNNVASLYGGIAARLAGVPMVLNTRHGMADMPYVARREQIYRLSVHFLHCVAFVCQRAKDFSERMGLVPPAKGVVVYNGVDMAPFRDLLPDAYADVRTELGLAPDTPLVGTVSRLTAAKDLPTWIAIADTLHRQRGDVRFVIVGAGEEEASIRALVAARQLEEVVRFTGRRSDVARWLTAFDVFLMTSVSEGMSLALIEASAAARPIVTTDVGGSADVVLDGETGFVIPVGDVDLAVARLTTLLGDPALATRMGAAGRERALTTFDIQSTCDAYAALYATSRES